MPKLTPICKETLGVGWHVDTRTHLPWGMSPNLKKQEHGLVRF